MCSEFKKNGVTITDTFFCPDLTGPDRKPNAGLFWKAQEKYNLDMENSISVGDKERDVLAGINAGVGRNYLLSSQNTGETKATKKISSMKELEDIL